MEKSYLIGYGADDFRYPEVELVPPPRVPLRAATDWHDVLHVNAWCHSSFLGNGNLVDGTRPSQSSVFST